MLQYNINIQPIYFSNLLSNSLKLYPSRKAGHALKLGNMQHE
jgi:hypothetical protein